MTLPPPPPLPNRSAVAKPPVESLEKRANSSVEDGENWQTVGKRKKPAWRVDLAYTQKNTMQVVWKEEDAETCMKLARSCSDDELTSTGSFEQLKQRMLEKSRALKELDPIDSPFSFVDFSGEVHFPTFEPHERKKNRDKNDRFYITDYHRCAIRNETHLLAAIEYSYPRLPSVILFSNPDKNEGALFLGGHSSSTNVEFFKAHNIKRVVCAARGLHLFPHHASLRQTMKSEMGVRFIDLDWDDSLLQDIGRDEIRTCMRFIEEGRKEGGGVLVHCAAGRSRSATVVVAYVASKYGKGVDEAMRLVQSRRLMALPNGAFLRQLKQFEEEGIFAKLREEMMGGGDGGMG